MDPNEALREIVEASATGDRESMIDNLNALLGWLLMQDGAMPAPYEAPSA
jgi:hypothetical protein